MIRHRLLLVALALLVGCATPVGVRRVDERTVQRTLTSNVLSTGEPSVASRQVLQTLGLYQGFQNDPEQTLAQLHDRVLEEMTLDRLFAAAEYSFLHGKRTDQDAYFVAASIYAFAFLFPEDGSAPPSEFDPRLRTAVDLYNRSVARALRSDEGLGTLVEGTYPFHLGTVQVELDPSGLDWADRRLDRFVPAAELQVRGLRNRHRSAGLGAPFVAEAVSVPGRTLDARSARVIDRTHVPVTFVVLYDDAREGLRSGNVPATLSVYSEKAATEIEVAGRTVPLEYETTSALAYGLEGSDLWSFGRSGFRSGDFLRRVFGVEDGLFMLRPHVPDRTPVVLVHGTASSPARWAELVNDLQSDPVVAAHYEFWLFIYTTGNPIVYSASLLRDSLRRAVAELDPGGSDTALRRMVLVGHSQGGLLVRLQAASSGDRFWESFSDQPFDQVSLEPQTRELLQDALFFEPLPFVKDVVFISTPHRGSFVAGNFLGRFASSLFTAPQNLLDVGLDLARAGVDAGRDALDATLDSIDSVRGDEDAIMRRRLDRIPSSVDNMDPDSSFIQTLSSLPLAPGIRAHSIIPVRGGPPPEGQNDGVVAFESAQLEGADSEFVVFHSGHSTQSNPLTIQEVRRILLHALPQQP
jgi:pimeloyl-ACP methyl ester carboxylesterase